MKIRAFAFIASGLSLVSQPIGARDDAAQRIDFTVAEEGYALAVPNGYCRTKGLEKVLSEQFAAADTANVTPIDIQRCGTFGTDYVLVKSPRGLPALPIPKDQFIPLLADELKKQDVLEAGFEQGRKNVDEATGGEMDVSLERISYSGSDEQCAYVSGTVNVAVKEGRSNKVLVGSCGTIVGTRHFFVHSYAGSESGITIAQLMARSKQVSLAISRK